MKNKRNFFYSPLIILAVVSCSPLQAQQKKDTQDVIKAKNLTTVQGPKGIVRTIKQDRNGNMWIASWQGVFKYDGKSFTNMTSKVSSARFFSVLEDRKGNFWFASVGSGVYYYNGRSFQNFTTKDGLINDRVTHIYEDEAGNMWFGTEGGASRYDGKSFRNFKMKERPAHPITDSVQVSVYQQQLPDDHWMHNDVNAIIEDKTGKFWFGTRGYAYFYDGKTFTMITNKEGKPFANVRSIIKDKKGNIWLGGSEGLWRYDGSTFTNLTQKFVGDIYEDKKGNIWTGSESSNNLGRELSGHKANNAVWTLSRYDEKSLSNKKPNVTEITNKPMIFGISEDDKGNIWFGAFDGLHLYDGKTIKDFKSKEEQK